MNILVLGNGFDLVHELTTKYSDYLKFARVMKNILSGTQISQVNWENVHPEIRRLELKKYYTFAILQLFATIK